jgi:urease accessory protein
MTLSRSSRSTVHITNTAMSNLPRLLQLCSQALPVGAYAYSQGLESAIHQKTVIDAQTAREWISGIFNHGISELDLPALFLAYDACGRFDLVTLNELNEYLAASRESRELLLEDVEMGRSLYRLLSTLDVDVIDIPQPSFVVQFAIAGCRWGIPARDLATGLSFSWFENQVAVATKSIPLGQSDAQKALSKLIELISERVLMAQQIAESLGPPGEWQFGQSMPALAIMSSQHEVLEARMYRS